MPADVPHLLHVFPTFVPAGAQVRTVQLMNALGGTFRHTVVGLDGRTEAMDLVEPGVPVKPMGVEAGSGPLAGLRAARRALRNVAPDAVLTYNWGSFDWVLASRALGRGHHLHHEDGFNADEAGGQKVRRVLARRLGLARSRLIVPSRSLQAIATETWRLPGVRLVPNGVHVDRFRGQAEGGAALRAELGIPLEALVVGAVGHLRAVKNFPRLVRAAARLSRELSTPGIHLAIFGDGAERGALEAVLREHAPPGGRVHLAGHRADLVPCYAALDVLAISSDSEQLPVSLLEAMASGVPVVGTRVGDVEHVLPEEARAGLVSLSEPDVEGSLARALEGVLTDPGRRAELARLGLERVQAEYSFGAMLEAYRAEYTAVTKG